MGSGYEDGWKNGFAAWRLQPSQERLERIEAALERVEKWVAQSGGMEEKLERVDKSLEMMVEMLNRLYEKVQGLEGESWVTPELNRDWPSKA